MKLTSFKHSFLFPFTIIYLIFNILGCGYTVQKRIPRPHHIIPPIPRLDNSGLYMCPYTQDGVLAEWVDIAINAKMGSSVGKITGTLLEKAATKGGSGGDLGNLVGEAIGRSAAIKASGGWNYIKSTSDISFNNLNDLAIYLYVKHSNNEHYKDALHVTMEIYPKLKQRFYDALKFARVDPLKVSQTPDRHIPFLNAYVVGSRFFNSEKNLTPYGKREYKYRFPKIISKYICCELLLKYPKHDKKINFKANAIYYNPDGSVFGRSTLNLYIMPEWTGSYHCFSRGYSKSKWWKVGDYWVDIYINDKMVASNTFNICLGCR